METAAEREDRIARLDRQRAERHAGPVWPTPDDVGAGRVQVAPGRGDLTVSSWSTYDPPTALWTIGDRPVSFARLFMSQPWVAAAVMRMLTWAIRVPLKVYRREGIDPADRTRLREWDHPLAAAILHQDGRSGPQLIMDLLGPILVHGNSVTHIDSGVNDAIQFTAKDWRYCSPIMPWRDSLQGFKFDTDQPDLAREFSIDNVLHIAYWSPAGPLGVSPLQQLGVSIQIEDAAQRFTRATFANSGRPPSAVTTSDAFLGLERPERQRIVNQLREDLDRIYAGPENAGKPALLPPGLDWKPLTHASFEAELIEQRRVVREEVSAVYLIPPPMLGILDKATYSNIETQREMIYTECMGPPLILIEAAINAQLVWRLMQESDVFVEFDFGVVLRGDRLQEIQALREAIGSALMTPNEGRGVLNMAKSTSRGMDQFYLPFNNLQPVGSPPVPTAAAPPAPGAPVGRRLHVRSRDRDYDVALA
jgi:HK97 family phage portal protein